MKPQSRNHHLRTLSVCLLLFITGLVAGCVNYNFDFPPPAADADITTLFPKDIGGQQAQVSCDTPQRCTAAYGKNRIIIQRFENQREMKAAMKGRGKFGVNTNLFTTGTVNSYSVNRMGGRVKATFKTSVGEYGILWTSKLYMFVIMAESSEKRDEFVDAFPYVAKKK